MICGSGKHNSVHIEQMSRSGAALTKRLDSAGRSFATARLGAGIVSSLNVGTAGAPEAAPRHAAGAPEAAPRALFAMGDLALGFSTRGRETTFCARFRPRNHAASLAKAKRS